MLTGLFLCLLLSLASCQLDLPPLRDDRLDGYPRQQDDRIRGYNRQQDDRIGGFNRQQDDRIGGYNRQQDDRLDGFNRQQDGRFDGYNRQQDDRYDGRNRQQGQRPDLDYENVLARLDFLGTERCSSNVAAQWAYETNVNEYTQLQAVRTKKKLKNLSFE